MATRELSLLADLDQGRLVQNFLSTLQATLPRFVFGDSIPVSFRPLKSNGNSSVNPWREVDLTGKTVRIAIGNPAGAASSGTFTLTYGANTTAAISYAADGATIQAALNAIASITAAGGVVVTKAATGAFRIVFNTAGARTAISADTAALYPSSGAEIRVAVDGDGSKREIIVVRLETLPAAYAELTDNFPVAASDIIEVRAGSGSAGAILTLEFTVLPYSGFYTLEIGGEQTLSVPWDADATAVQSALELLSTVGAGMVSVSGDFPRFTLNFDLSLEDIGAMTLDASGLIVPRGRVGTLNTNTAGTIELLNGAAQATAKLEIELRDDGDGTTWTVYQGDCTVIDDVIGNALSEIGGPIYSQPGIGDTAPVNAVAGVSATGSITFSGSPTPGDTITIGGITYYLAPGTSPAFPTDVTTPFLTENATTWAAAVAAKINAWNNGGADANVSATSSGGVVTLTNRSTGTAGNSVTLSETATNVIVSGATLTGGVAAVAGTAGPPFIRVAGGFLYIQEAGVWKRAALSSF